MLKLTHEEVKEIVTKISKVDMSDYVVIYDVNNKKPILQKSTEPSPLIGSGKFLLINSFLGIKINIEYNKATNKQEFLKETYNNLNLLLSDSYKTYRYEVAFVKSKYNKNILPVSYQDLVNSDYQFTENKGKDILYFTTKNGFFKIKIDLNILRETMCLDVKENIYIKDFDKNDFMYIGNFLTKQKEDNAELQGFIEHFGKFKN